MQISQFCFLTFSRIEQENEHFYRSHPALKQWLQWSPRGSQERCICHDLILTSYERKKYFQNCNLQKHSLSVVHSYDTICMYLIIKDILLFSHKQYLSSSGGNIVITLAREAFVALWCWTYRVVFTCTSYKCWYLLGQRHWRTDQNQRETTPAGSRSAIFVKEK